MAFNEAVIHARNTPITPITSVTPGASTGALPSALTSSLSTLVTEEQAATLSVVWQEGLQLVPVNWFRSLGMHVEWHSAYRSAAIRYNGITIAYPANSFYADVHQPSVHADWQRKTLPIAARLIDGRMYVPLGYTLRFFGWEARYEAQHGQHGRTYIAADAAQVMRLMESATALATNQQKVLKIGQTVSTARGIAVSERDIYWLEQLTEAEAGGESYRGKLAVAATVLNRVHHPDYPQSIQETIFQVTRAAGRAYYQFSPVLDERIYQMRPSTDTKRAVDAALKGEDPTFGATVFYNPAKTDNAWVRSRPTTIIIGNHVFAK